MTTDGDNSLLFITRKLLIIIPQVVYYMKNIFNKKFKSL